MTLDANTPRGERNRRSRAARKDELREYDEKLRVSRPWLFPLLVGAAIVVLAGVIVYWLVSGG